MSRSSKVTEIQPKSEIFIFDLSWSDIQTLKRKCLNFTDSTSDSPSEISTMKLQYKFLISAHPAVSQVA